MRRIVTLLTDFGERDGYAGIVRGVVASGAPEATIVDLGHAVTPHDVVGGALVLAAAVDHFPEGTVHLAVVDPGVGGERRALAIETERFVLVGPDNGLLDLAARRSEVRGVVELDRPEVHGPRRSSTFHGRDVFGPVAAHLARGVVLREVGTPLPDAFVRLPIVEPEHGEGTIRGEVVYVDHFGNLVSNVEAADLERLEKGGFVGPGLSITIAGVRIPGVASHYGAVGRGDLVALVNSWERLEIAVREGSAAERLGVDRGALVTCAAKGR